MLGSGRGRRKRTHTTGTSPAIYFTEIGQAGFGGGPTEKALPSRDLAGGLPDRTPGSESGLGKRAGGNTDTAPQADSTWRSPLDGCTSWASRPIRRPSGRPSRPATWSWILATGSADSVPDPGPG